MKPVLAITMGDAAGIGPEIILKVLSRLEPYELCKPLVVGDLGIMTRDAERLGRRNSVPQIRGVETAQDARFEYGTVEVLQAGDPLGDIAYGTLSEAAGRAAVSFVRTAAALAAAGETDGIVTAPLNKEAIQKAGFQYPGHTELLAEAFHVERFSLVLNSGSVFVFHVTTHLALRDACALITAERVERIIDLAHGFARALNRPAERVAVIGLNPHAGENGLFGNEDRDEIAPAVRRAQSRGIPAEGPLPGDTLFPQVVKGRYSFVVAMYHDQGHIPFKSVYFDEGVNITVGLPIIRTSVDHGTAFDIAGSGQAQDASMLAAIQVAARFAPEWGTIRQVLEVPREDGTLGAAGLPQPKIE